MIKNVNKHAYPIIDIMIERAVDEVHESGETISCRKGCSHCCHLFIEITWDEAEELARFICRAGKKEKQRLICAVQENAQAAREILNRRKSTRKFMQPIDDDSDIPESVFDRYFGQKALPCPFLKDNVCGAYDYRPSPCRLHLVTSPNEDCARDSEEGVDVPQEIEEVREQLGPVLGAISEDPRWGQMSIMVEAVLMDMGEVTSCTA